MFAAVILHSSMPHTRTTCEYCFKTSGVKNCISISPFIRLMLLVHWQTMLWACWESSQLYDSHPSNLIFQASRGTNESLILDLSSGLDIKQIDKNVKALLGHTLLCDLRGNFYQSHSLTGQTIFYQRRGFFIITCPFFCHTEPLPVL